MLLWIINKVKKIRHSFVFESTSVSFTSSKYFHDKIFFLSFRTKTFKRIFIRIFDFQSQFDEITNLNQDFYRNLQFFFEIKAEVPSTF